MLDAHCPSPSLPIHLLLFMMMRFINIMFSCVVISLLCFLLVCSASWVVEGQCLDEHRHLLLHFKHNLSFSSKSGVPVGLSSWDLNTDCCRSWEGVECNPIGEVIGLDLSDKFIAGSIDGLASLFQLTHLQRLDLSCNDFNSAIPSGFDRLPHLTHLNLSNSGFVGQIPIGISHLTRLVSLDLSTLDLRVLTFNLSTLDTQINLLKLDNPDLRMLVGNLSNLRVLKLGGVNVSDKGNQWSQVLSSALPKLQVLSLSSCSLSGPFDSSLLKLLSLSDLRLSWNNFSTEIPEFFGSFFNLTTLSLFNCGLKGNLPQSIFKLPKLRVLSISDNPLLEGSLPEFSQNNSLQILALFNTSFSGELPISIGNLKHLSTLLLSKCRFNGSIPSSLFALPSLKKLHLSSNQFTGHLGSSNIKFGGPIILSIFNISSLEFVDLSYNQFNGSLELNRFEALTNLNTLVLSGNMLSIDTNCINSALFPQVRILRLGSCNLGVFPDFLRNQSKLTDLDLSNNSIVGNLPSWIEYIGNGSLHRLNLSCNSLENPELTFSDNSFDKLDFLDLHSNLFQGPIPILPPSASILEYSNNNISFIPSNIGSYLSIAIFFSLANNNIHGPFPESLCNVGLIRYLDLSNNSLSGSLPAMFREDCALRTINLNGNRLEGQVPRSLGYCKMLEVVDLGSNLFNSTFPHWLGNLATLRVLILRSNLFQGPIGLPQLNYSFPMLQVIDISSNRFSGILPSEWLMSWNSMRMDEEDTQSMVKLQIQKLGFLELGDAYYLNEVTIMSKGLVMKLENILIVFACVDLSNNAFEGAIPDNIGDLKALHALNLSHNAFSGLISPSMGNLKQLESLDLSQNQFSGMIPSELTGITFLSVLNLSYNNLVGKIPSGSQFDTFEEISYKGNNGLCGHPLSKNCNVVDQHTPDNRADDDHKDGLCEALKFLFCDCTDNKSEFKWQLIVTALGFGVGNGIACWLVLVFYGSRSKCKSRHGRNRHGRNRL